MIDLAMAADESGWTFLSNHSHVLLLLAGEPGLSLREVSLRVGITERSVQRIVSDLEAAGCLRKEKVGRMNNYRIDGSRPLRHPLEAHHQVGGLLEFLLGAKPGLLPGLETRGSLPEPEA